MAGKRGAKRGVKREMKKGAGRAKEVNLRLIALVIAVMALMFFFLLKGTVISKPGHGTNDNEADTIARSLIAAKPEMDNGLAVVINDKVDKQRLALLANTPYAELKAKLGVKKDFAVYFADGNDAVVLIGTKTCIGSPEAEVAGEKCG